jgi:hypothetical protein
VTTGRTTREKMKRRRTVKPPRRNSSAAPRHTDSVASLKKRNAALARQLTEAAAQQKAASKRETAIARELSQALEQQAATSEVLRVISSASPKRGGEKRINGPPPQPSLPAVRHAIVNVIMRAKWRDVPTVDSCTAAKTLSYGITSSARCWKDEGTSIPSVFAVLRLITSS